ncbi:MAG: RHS repeat-associated core domain-containing protein, partial [Alistipes sp.]|nr:RHS repeat-associated core domain-containing protein [Alistipes sp.]
GQEINTFITDHLGSVRAIRNSAGNIESVAEYYPYGLKWSGAGLMASTNRWLYNGKELQDAAGLDLLDYGFRMYDPFKGSWNGMDKLAEENPGISPYVYVDNSPIIFIDPDGKRKWKFQVSISMNTGKVSGKVNIGSLGVGGIYANGGGETTLGIFVGYDTKQKRPGIGVSYNYSDIYEQTEVSFLGFTGGEIKSKSENYEYSTFDGLVINKDERYISEDYGGIGNLSVDEKSVFYGAAAEVGIALIGVKIQIGIIMDNTNKSTEMSQKTKLKNLPGKEYIKQETMIHEKRKKLNEDEEENKR